MAAESTLIRKDDVDAALRAVRGAEQRAKLASLAYDTLSRQAEGRAFYTAQNVVRARAQEHGVTYDGAATEAGNLLAILERGAQKPLERALVAAFAVAGFGDALSGDDEKTASARVSRFVRHADWLEVSTDYRVYPFVDALLDVQAAARVYRELAQAVVDEAAGRDGEQARVRARNAARLTALASSSAEAAREALRAIVRSTALDEPTRLLASTLAGDGAAEAVTVAPRVAGRLGRPPRRGIVDVLGWVSGIAILLWALRGLAFVLGLRRDAELRLGARELEVRTKVSLFGRTVREREQTIRLEALESAAREVRYPAIHLLVGALALSAGVLVGGLVLFDGARSGELVLVSLAALLVLGGAGLDLALDVLVSARRGRVVLDVRARGQRPLRVAGVSIEEADAFLRALRARVASS